MSRLSELLKKLTELETTQARQDGKEIPACVFLSSGDFDGPETRQAEHDRLHAEYGDQCKIIEFDSVGPDGSTCWKGGPVPNLETILGSDEYRRAEREAYVAIEGEKPAGQPNTPPAPETLTEPQPALFNAVPPIEPESTHLRTLEPVIDESDPPARPLPPSPMSREEWQREIHRVPEHMLREPYDATTDPPPAPEKDISWMFGGTTTGTEPRRRHPGEIRFRRGLP